MTKTAPVLGYQCGICKSIIENRRTNRCDLYCDKCNRIQERKGLVRYTKDAAGSWIVWGTKSPKRVLDKYGFKATRDD